jgi:hypothetical protein
VEAAPSPSRRPGNVVGDPLLTGSAPITRRPVRRPPAASPGLTLPDDVVAGVAVADDEVASSAGRGPVTAPTPAVAADPTPPPQARSSTVVEAPPAVDPDPTPAPVAAPVVEAAPAVEVRTEAPPRNGETARVAPVAFVPEAPEVPVQPAPVRTAAVPAVAPVVVPAPLEEPAAMPYARRTEIPKVSRRLRWRARRPRVRKVSRVVRRIDPWTVLKVSVIFWLLTYAVLLVAGVLLWNLANTTGTVENVEGFIRDLFALETFEFDGDRIFRASWVLGAVMVVAGTGLNLVGCVLFNLITDLVGGVRITVLEEEVVLRERPVGAPSKPRS